MSKYFKHGDFSPRVQNPQAEDIKRHSRLKKANKKNQQEELLAKREAAFSEDFSLTELEAALQRLPTKKAPGPDRIHNEFLINCPRKAQIFLLSIFNRIWKQGEIPRMWKLAIVCPIHKKGKPANEADSFRPVSLLSSVSKTMERMVANRLIWWMDTNELFSPYQAGFRRFHDTFTHVLRLSEAAKQGMQSRAHTLAVFIDLKSAYDSVWRVGLEQKLYSMGIRGKMYCWLASFLSSRQLQVRWNGIKDRPTNVPAGVPQGSVIAPLLFLTYINDIGQHLPKSIQLALFADDIALWATGMDFAGVSDAVQRALHCMERWTTQWRLIINPQKTQLILFSLAKAKTINSFPWNLTLSGRIIPLLNTAEYLGIKWDRRLTWRALVDQKVAQARQRLNLLRRLASTSWGANIKVLRSLYLAYIRPVLQYGDEVLLGATQSQTTRLDKVQNQALRKIIGVGNSAPIAAMEMEARIPPLTLVRSAKAASRVEGMRRLPDQHVLKKTIQDMDYEHQATASPRLVTQTSLVGHTAHITEALPQQREQMPTTSICPATAPPMGLSVVMEPSLRGGVDDISQLFPREDWIQVFTDGSVNIDKSTSGIGILMRFPDRQPVSISEAMGPGHSINQVEQKAILSALQGLEMADQDSPLPTHNVVIFTDSLSSLQAIHKAAFHLEPPSAVVEDILTQVQFLQTVPPCGSLALCLQKVSAHTGLPGNEQADALAKAASSLPEQPQMPLSQADLKIILKKKLHQHWHTLWTVSRTAPLYRHLAAHHQAKDPAHHDLPRHQQTLIAALRFNRFPTAQRMHRIGKKPSPDCVCGEPETIQHMLLECPATAKDRQMVWPTLPSLRACLFGSREELNKTIRFVHSTRPNIC